MSPEPKRAHRDDDCQARLTDGTLCLHWAMYKMIRIDDTFILFCARHANIEREIRDACPKAFNPVRFVTVASGDLAARS
jgi:hypothetical protein